MGADSGHHSAGHPRPAGNQPPGACGRVRNGLASPYIAWGVATASTDSTVRLWNPDTGQPIGEPLTGHTGAVLGVTFSPDGHLLATASNDKTVRLWPADASPEVLCAKLTTNLSHQQWRDWVSPDIDYVEVCPGLPIPVDG
jgi:WD40 repeat protein